MASSLLKASHLGGTHIKSEFTPAECARTTSCLLMAFQQDRLQPCLGQQGCGCEAGNARP
jgi:hypothetical protein